MLAQNRFQKAHLEAILIISEDLPSKSELIWEGHNAVLTSTAPDDD